MEGNSPPSISKKMDAAVFGCLVDLDSYEMQGEKRPEWGKELQIGVSLVVRCGLRDEKTYQRSRIERHYSDNNDLDCSATASIWNRHFLGIIAGKRLW